ncbi:MAG: endonuclease NucS [Acidobacteria bacterium]|nr:endonuclease NucS [Acidobacteriota bacterium]
MAAFSYQQAEEIRDALRLHGVRYLFIGKLGAILHGYAVVELKSRERVEAESLLEDTLVANPDLLGPGLKRVGRQVPTAGGPLDLLGVDGYGRLALFELKRGMLTRDAVAQVIDYAADLEALDLVDLTRLIAEESSPSTALRMMAGPFSPGRCA